MIKDGNIRWFANATNPNVNTNYPKVGYLDWMREEYGIYEVIGMNGEASYWLDRGIRITSLEDSSEDNRGATYIRPGKTVTKEGEIVGLGDEFDSLFLSSHTFEKFVPPECVFPTREEIKEAFKNHTDLELMKDLNFVDSEGNNIYSSKKHRIWMTWDDDKREPVKRYTSFVIPSAIERIRVRYAECKWENEKLNITADSSTEKTSRARWNFGAMYQFGDWNNPASPNKKRAWFNPFEWGEGIDMPYQIPYGFFDLFDESMTQEEINTTLLKFLEDNPSESTVWNPHSFWNFAVPAIFASVLMTDYFFWRGGPFSDDYGPVGYNVRKYKDVTNIPFIHYLFERPLRPSYWITSILFPRGLFTEGDEGYYEWMSNTLVTLTHWYSRAMRWIFGGFSRYVNWGTHTPAEDPINGWITWGILAFTAFVGDGIIRCIDLQNLD